MSFEHSYLVGGDCQFLGFIKLSNDPESILNSVGIYGSEFSDKSIFNPFSEYGSMTGKWSLNNPRCENPPRFFLKGRYVTVVSANEDFPNRITPALFMNNLIYHVPDILKGRFPLHILKS